MSLEVWIKDDALDAQNPNTKQKVRKLVRALIKEREWVLKEMRSQAELAGSIALTVLQELGMAIDSGNDPLWGTYGPMQGVPTDRISALSGKLHTIDETLRAIYTLFPELKPKEQEDGTGPKPAKGSKGAGKTRRGSRDIKR